MNSQNNTTLTTLTTLTITTKDGSHDEQRTISNEVLDDAFALMNYQRAQIVADPNVAKVEISIKVS